MTTDEETIEQLKEVAGDEDYGPSLLASLLSISQLLEPPTTRIEFEDIQKMYEITEVLKDELHREFFALTEGDGSFRLAWSEELEGTGGMFRGVGISQRCTGDCEHEPNWMAVTYINNDLQVVEAEGEYGPDETVPPAEFAGPVQAAQQALSELHLRTAALADRLASDEG